METFRRFRIPCLVVALVLLNCSDYSNPLVPEILRKNELAYFPLEEGYKAVYSFKYNHYKPDSWKITIHRFDGTFTLEVIDILAKEADEEVYYKLATSLFVREEYFHLIDESNPLNPIYDEYTRNDYSIDNSHEVMLKNGSLWYVENAPSFERLGEGDTSLMMAAPIAGGGEMNLKLFECLGNKIDLTMPSYWLSSEDSTCIYRSEYNVNTGAPKTIIIHTSKLKGLNAITCFEQMGGGSMIFRYRTDFIFELIE